MASLRDIKKRIRSVTGSQKITRAMKLVAASKLRRAQQAANQARPYAEEVSAMVSRVAQAAADEAGDKPVHPLCQRRPVKTCLLIVVTSDRGSCGAFNSNVVRRTDRFLREQKSRAERFMLMTLGRKGNDAFGRRAGLSVRHVPDMVAAPRFARIEQLAHEVMNMFLSNKIDEAFVIYNEAQGALAQVVRMRDVLPVAPNKTRLVADGAERPKSPALPAVPSMPADYLFSPSKQELLDTLVPMQITVALQRALLESVAAEHGARMAAMDAATKNAGQMVEALTLQYNRARQAAITLELMDIVGGAEALAG